MKVRTKLFAIFTTLAVVFGMGMVSVAAASPTYTASYTHITDHYGSKVVCSFRDTGNGCMTADGTAGDLVQSAIPDNDADETLDADLLTTECNSGFVNSTCPFWGGNLNTHFSGDEINDQHRTDIVATYFYGNFSGANVHQETDIRLIVFDGNCANLNTSGCVEIAVDATNSLHVTNEYEAICDPGRGNPLTLEVQTIGTAVPERCRWYTT